MAVIISMLRGVNLGSHHRIKMDALRACYESIKLRDPRTYVQSGNVIFASNEKDFARLAQKVEKAIETAFGFRADVILRTTAELKSVVARNPFAKRKGIEPGKLLVTFLAAEPALEARQAVLGIKADPEEMYLDGRELYTYYPNGMGRSKLSFTKVEKALRVRGTSRNWNSVLKMLEMAQEIESLS